ncbi:hypothetical protein ATSB10_37970 [Dyella thiooxydans]|uniref:Uncharacterized protein n=1 Tax=Dyella thiooxydans TaxID=445710 RepID=A0A160N556_9GAMM|nr:hypothetical protein ATSB10_37970 [Dyella thiooxydans]
MTGPSCARTRVPSRRRRRRTRPHGAANVDGPSWSSAARVRPGGHGGEKRRKPPGEGSPIGRRGQGARASQGTRRAAQGP